MKKINEIKVGDIAELSHVITKEDVRKFVELTGDDNRLHIDEDFASQTTFKKTVVHGMLGASFISTLIGTKLPGDGAVWFAQNLEFLLPVRVGDVITVKAEVIKVIENHNIVEMKIHIENQNRQTVTSGMCKVKLAELEQADPIEDKKPYQKVALIVGASGGIGKATCMQLAKDGFDIAIHYYKNENLIKEIKKEIESLGKRAIIVKSDITDHIQVKSMFEEIKRYFETITVLVNCTTIKVANTHFSMLEWKDMQDHFDVNIKGSFNLIKAVVPIMEKQKYGKIILITTQYTEGTPPSELAHYVTAKTALNGFSKALAVELAPKGIRVNMISPGMTQTDLIADIPEKTKLMAKAKTPLKKLARPEDIADAISFLASEKSDFLTGETIRVNGGQVML